MDHRATASKLGLNSALTATCFNAIVDNAYDASQIASMDQPVEVSGIVTSIALHAGNFVEDLLTQYAQARPWILLAEGGSNTYVSSAMPQKRNLACFHRTRRDASTSIALATAEGATHNITPHESDPKEVKTTALWSTAPSLC
ncbi:MAG: hypothetical protein R3E56_08575 [Burkholderiaceae bacterium]